MLSREYSSVLQSDTATYQTPKEARNHAKKSPKARQTVSAAGVFKSKARTDNGKKRNGRKEGFKKSDLFVEFRGNLGFKLV